MSQSVFVNGGFSNTDKVPGAYGEVAPATGAISASSIPLKVLLVGLKTSDGSAVVEQDILPIYSLNDSIVAYGARSQITNMAKAALNSGQPVLLYAVACTEAGTVAAQVTVTFTVGSAWTAPIQYTATIDGQDISFSIPVGATVTQIAASFASAINAFPQLPVVATSATGVTTIKAANLGTSGNTYIYFEDKTLATGLTTAIAGGTVLPGGGVPFSGGTGTESVANVQALIYTQQYDRIAIGQVDATNIALWITQLNAQAMPTDNHRQQVVVGFNGTYAAATTLATTNLNNSRFQLVEYQNCESPPWEIAAAMAATRCGFEQNDPDASFDGMILKGIRGQRAKADIPSHPQQVALLNNGVTPVTTDLNGNAVVVRAITSRSLNGTIPDYRLLDTSQQTVPDFVLTDLMLLWTTEYLPANPRVQNDPPNANVLPAGVATPLGWQRKVNGYLQTKASQPQPIVVAPSPSTQPSATWNTVANCIQLVCPVVPSPNQHQVLISVRPTAYIP